MRMREWEKMNCVKILKCAWRNVFVDVLISTVSAYVAPSPVLSFFWMASDGCSEIAYDPEHVRATPYEAIATRGNSNSMQLRTMVPGGQQSSILFFRDYQIWRFVRVKMWNRIIEYFVLYLVLYEKLAHLPHQTSCLIRWSIRQNLNSCYDYISSWKNNSLILHINWFLLNPLQYIFTSKYIKLLQSTFYRLCLIRLESWLSHSLVHNHANL